MSASEEETDTAPLEPRSRVGHRPQATLPVDPSDSSANPVQNLQVPSAPVGHDEEAQRKRDRSNTRRVATDLLREFETIRNSSSPNVEDLEWLLHRAKLLEIRSQATDSIDPASHHSDSLEALIFKGKGLLKHLQDLRSAHVAAVQAAVPALPAHAAPGFPTFPPPSSPSGHQGLPRLDLPRFDGDPLSWRPFDAQFQASVGSRNIPEVQKLVYLMSCLQGEAKKSLQNLPLTAGNYSVAQEILKSRFGNPANLVALYAHEVVNLKSVSDNDVSGLRRFLDQFTAAHRELKSLLEEVQGGQPDSHGFLLGPLVCGKLPPSLQLVWSRQCSTPAERFDLEKVLAFAEKELAALEALPPKLRNTSEKPTERPSRSSKPSSATFVQRSRQDEPKKAHKCPKCQEGHILQRCPAFLKMSPEARGEELKRLRLCFNCMMPHMREVCKSDKTCLVCGHKHHSLLHRGAPVTSTAMMTASQQKNPSPRSLLQTALVHVENCSQPARVLLVSGAECSYVSERFLSQVRRPQIVHRQLHRYEAFGGGVHEQHVPVVDLTLKSRHSGNQVKMRLLVLPKLCSSVRGIKRHKVQGLKLQGRRLADEPGHDGPVDILLGADLLPRVMAPTAPSFADGLILTETMFGWVVSGPVADHESSNLSAVAKILFLAEKKIPDLWDLETFGVPDKPGGTPEAVDPDPRLQEGRYTCLLYTSPSPRDKRQSRMPSSA